MAMHPWDRLRRTIPGERQFEPRGLVVQLYGRDKELRTPRVVLGEKFALAQPKTRNNTHVAEPRPNAPLLKRIVRYPYAMDGVRGTRKPMRDAVPWKDLERAPLPNLGEWLAQDRQAPSFPNPVIAGQGLRLIARKPLPTVAEWLSEPVPGDHVG